MRGSRPVEPAKLHTLGFRHPRLRPASTSPACTSMYPHVPSAAILGRGYLEIPSGTEYSMAICSCQIP